MNKDIFDILKKLGLKQELLDNKFTNEKLGSILGILRQQIEYMKRKKPEEYQGTLEDEFFKIVSELVDENGNFKYVRVSDGTIANECDYGGKHCSDIMYVDVNGNVVYECESYPDEKKKQEHPWEANDRTKIIREFDKSGVQISVEKIHINTYRNDMSEHYKIVRNPDFVTETVYTYPMEGVWSMYQTPMKVGQRFVDCSFRDNENGLIRPNYYSLLEKYNFGNVTEEQWKLTVDTYGLNGYGYDLPRRIPEPRGQEDINKIEAKKRMMLLEALENGLLGYDSPIFTFDGELAEKFNKAREQEESYAKKSFMKYALGNGLIKAVTQEDGSISYVINEDMIKVNPKDFYMEEVEAPESEKQNLDVAQQMQEALRTGDYATYKRLFDTLSPEEKINAIINVQSRYRTEKRARTPLAQRNADLRQEEQISSMISDVEKEIDEPGQDIEY